MQRQLYINLPVKDLERSVDFFSRLGFSFNPQFSDTTAACMILGRDIFLMLLSEAKFASFAPNPVADARKVTEVLNCLSCSSREDVDALVAAALAAGGSTFREPQDYGFMYGHAFQDPDGHVWELSYMDLDKAGASG